jgi:hypothetical protein
MGGIRWLERPEDAEAGAEGRHGQVADVIASALEGAVVADSGLGVGRERNEAIDLFEDGKVGLGMVDRLKAAEGLVVLVEASDTCACAAGASVTSSTVLSVAGMVSLQMLLARLDQRRLMKSKITEAS